MNALSSLYLGGHSYIHSISLSHSASRIDARIVKSLWRYIVLLCKVPLLIGKSILVNLLKGPFLCSWREDVWSGVFHPSVV